MTNEDAEIRLRNLLIKISRHYVSMVGLSKAIKESAVEADKAGILHAGSVSGLHCQGNTIRKRAYELKKIIMDEKESMIRIFGTSNLHMIAKQEIKIILKK